MRPALLLCAVLTFASASARAEGVPPPVTPGTNRATSDGHDRWPRFLRPPAQSSPLRRPPAPERRALEQTMPGESTASLAALFRGILSPHGRWLRTQRYGEVWTPTSIPREWRPFARGRWVFTDQGWTFVAGEPWGWCTMHYGRWTFLGARGWVWIPGRQWSPAPVAWRYGPDLIAWVPLPPPGTGSADYFGVLSRWNAVRPARFLRPFDRSHLIPTAKLSRTLAATRFSGAPPAGTSLGPPPRYVSRVTGAPVRRLSAASVAPRWVAKGGHRPNDAWERARRSAPVIARPGDFLERRKARAARYRQWIERRRRWKTTQGTWRGRRRMWRPAAPADWPAKRNQRWEFRLRPRRRKRTPPPPRPASAIFSAATPVFHPRLAYKPSRLKLNERISNRGEDLSRPRPRWRPVEFEPRGARPRKTRLRVATGPTDARAPAPERTGRAP